MGLHKSTIGKEAVRQLTAMRDMLAEDHWNGNAVSFHANSANNYLQAIRAAGLAVPEFSCGVSFLRAHGWKIEVAS